MLFGFSLKHYNINGGYGGYFLKYRLPDSSGFTQRNVEELEQRLLTIARTEDVQEVIASPYDTKYVVEGTIDTSSGGKMAIRSIWIIETGEDSPRLVTAYPV